MNRLIPTLRLDVSKKRDQALEYGKKLMEQCRQALSLVLPFTENESEFLDALLERGEIIPDLLTADAQLQELIRRQPLLEWKSLHVRRHKGLS